MRARGAMPLIFADEAGIGTALPPAVDEVCVP